LKVLSTGRRVMSIGLRIKQWLGKLNLEASKGTKQQVMHRPEGVTRIFFATDIHGSTICWKKFINAALHYDANVLILGGDTTGKAIVPIIAQSDGTYKCYWLRPEGVILRNKGEVEKMAEMIENAGYYPYIVTERELKELTEAEGSKELVDKIFKELMKARIEKWIKYAEEKLLDKGINIYVCPGNDDPFEIDETWQRSKLVIHAEGKTLKIDNYYTMISTGWTNPTPWKTYRETDEETLERMLEELVAKVKDINWSIFNFHAPPYNSTLDLAPELDENLRPKYGGRSFVPVGSKAVRKIIEKYQPPLSLHGHVHESKGERRIGRTLAVNPGSNYQEGVLQAVIIDLDQTGVKTTVFVSG
jgi:Icc-related predicted phosphoesterase